MTLPEALIEHAADRIAGRTSYSANWRGHEAREVAVHQAREVIRAALAFRDESGHRVVWSAEEVAGITEERNDARLAVIDLGARWQRAQARVAALAAEVHGLRDEREPLIEALRAVRALVVPMDNAPDTVDPIISKVIVDLIGAALDRMIDWHERGDMDENHDRFHADMRAARAALARVPGPEPAQEKCKVCGGSGRRRTRETHGGNPEPSEYECYGCNGTGTAAPRKG